MGVASARVVSPQQLHGEWLIAADPTDRGAASGWPTAIVAHAQPAPVPGVAQQALPNFQFGTAWYWHRFRARELPRLGERALIRFGTVDHVAEVWLNGRRLGGHIGVGDEFTLDATAALLGERDNLLAVRVGGLDVAPSANTDPSIAPVPETRSPMVWQPGGGVPIFGILRRVSYVVVPSVRIGRLWLRPQADGRLVVTTTIINDTDTSAAARLALDAMPGAGGDAVADGSLSLTAPSGESDHEAVLTISAPRRWDIDDPFLYRVEARLIGPDLAHAQSARCGFREFTVAADGAFQLNGRRLWMRSTHTGNHFPVGVIVPIEDFHRRDMLMAKAAGYNAVRFIARPGTPEQLDLCDEIGLLVYEESRAAWLMREVPDYPAFHDRELRAMITRDRNHPCVVIWGLLNECTYPVQIAHARDSLPLLRALDPTRVALFMSGRWDGTFSTGTICLPHESRWRHTWGADAPDAKTIPFDPDWKLDRQTLGYIPGAGDAHMYPQLPMSETETALLRNLGHVGKPVYLSEFGIGSMFNVIEERKGFERHQARVDLGDYAVIASMADRFAKDWSTWGMDTLYPFAEDFLRASAAHMSRQRASAFSLIRANPHLVGYNLTGMLDHGLTGEGMWTFWRRWKPGSLETLQDGWAPLRWCVIAPRHAHFGRPFPIEVVLADDAALPAGHYTARIRVFTAGRGAVWERSVSFDVAAGPRDARPIAIPVLRCEIPDLAPGDHILAADLPHGGIAAADRLSFTIAAPPAALSGSVATIGLAPDVERWLTGRGLRCQPFLPNSAHQTILIGDPSPEQLVPDLWASVLASVERGATAVFLSPDPFLAKPEARPLGGTVSVRWVFDWLYHHDGCAKPHALFAGLRTGLIDWDHWGSTAGHHLFTVEAPGAEIIAAGFATGYPTPGGYLSGAIVAIVPRGAGRIVLNGLRIVPFLDRHPVADRLLENYIAYAQTSPSR